MQLQALAHIFAVALLTSCDSRMEEMSCPASSMEPTIMAGSKVIVDTQAYDADAPKRFDLVVFTPPHNPDSRFAFTVVGLPGETINLDGEGLLIDGTEIKHPNGIAYIAADESRKLAPASGIKIRNEARLGPAQYFVLGDNTTNALDSRYFGPISRQAIHGKITKIEQDEAQNPGDG